MRFKLDENLPRAARRVLEAQSWDVHDVHEEKLAGAIDSEIRATCMREDRVLVTLDTDFADVRLVSPDSPGIMLLRPNDQSIPATVACLEASSADAAHVDAEVAALLRLAEFLDRQESYALHR